MRLDVVKSDEIMAPGHHRSSFAKILAVALLAYPLGGLAAPAVEIDDPRPGQGPSSNPFYAGRKLTEWLQLLESDDPDLRLGAARSLGDLGPEAEPAVPWLIHALEDRNGEVRFFAAVSLGKIGPGAASSIPAMARALRRADGFTKGVIGPAFARFGAVSIPTLVELTHDDDDRVRYEAVRALRLLGPLAIETKSHLIERLTETDHGIRQEAAFALWKLDADRQWLDILIRSLEDPDDYAQATAAHFLKTIGPGAEAAIPTLLKILTNPSDSSKGLAAMVLAAIGPKASVAVPAMLECSSRPNKGYLVRGYLAPIGPAAVDALIAGLENPASLETAAEALGSIGKPSRAALPRLRGLLAHSPAKEQVAIARAIWQIEGDISVVPVLEAVLLEEDFISRASAFTTLEEIGPSASGAIPTLIGRLGHPNQFVREGASKVLGAIGPEAREAVPLLEKALEDPETSNRIEAAKALWRIDQSESAVKILVAEARKVSDSGHSFAVLALGEIGPDAASAVPALIDALSDTSIYGKALAAQALGKIGPAAKLAVRRLVEIHNDLDNTERSEFAKVIKALDPIAAAKAGVR